MAPYFTQQILPVNLMRKQDWLIHSVSAPVPSDSQGHISAILSD